MKFGYTAKCEPCRKQMKNDIHSLMGSLLFPLIRVYLPVVKTRQIDATD